MIIDHIHGRLISVYDDHIVVQAGGVGYHIYIANTGQPQLAEFTKDQTVYTFHQIREDSQALFGFFSMQDRNFFTALIEVQGVGPKLALKILCGLSPGQITQAVFEGRADVLTQAPGVGKKLAEKLVADLRDKLPKTAFSGTPLKLSNRGNNLDPDLLLAMKTLGYSADEIKRAHFKASHLISSTTPLDIAIKTLLQHLG